MGSKRDLSHSNMPTASIKPSPPLSYPKSKGNKTLEIFFRQKYIYRVYYKLTGHKALLPEKSPKNACRFFFKYIHIFFYKIITNI